MSHERWSFVVDSVLTRHYASLQRLQARMKSAEQIMENMKRNIEAIRDEMEAEIERGHEEINRAISWRNDPVVYVRNYGETTLEVYHSGLDCGWVGSTRVRKILLGEAKTAGLRPCYSCGHLAVSHQEADAAA